MEERQFKGIWIPKEIWLSENLTLQEKIILVEIDSLETEEKGCYASNKYFAEFFKISLARVSQIIKSLEKKKYLRVDYITENKQILERQLRIQKPPYPEVLNILKGGIKYSKGGYLENYKDNNINNNNINNKENNNINIITKERFKKPTLEEVEEYCKQRNSSVDPKTFYEYFETGGWIDSKGNKVKNWKQKIITWEGNRKQSDGQTILDTFEKNNKVSEMNEEEKQEMERLLNEFSDVC